MAKNNAPSTSPLQYSVGKGITFISPATTGIVIADNPSLINAVTVTGGQNPQQKTQIDGTATIPIPAGVVYVHYVINLPTNFFSSANTYRVLTTFVASAVLPLPSNWAIAVSANLNKQPSQFTIGVASPNLAVSASAGYVVIDWFAIGY
jgi:hypothetical protein